MVDDNFLLFLFIFVMNTLKQFIETSAKLLV